MMIDSRTILVAMIERGMTRTELAAPSGVPQRTLRDIESGRMVSPTSISRICLCLGIKPRDVLIDERDLRE